MRREGKGVGREGALQPSINNRIIQNNRESNA